jgi:hypothetical protein
VLVVVVAIYPNRYAVGAACGPGPRCRQQPSPVSNTVTVTSNGRTVTAHGVGHNSTLAPGGIGEWGMQVSRPNRNTTLPGPATCTSP